MVTSSYSVKLFIRAQGKPCSSSVDTVQSTVCANTRICYDFYIFSDSKVHGANMGPTWVLPALDGPRVGPMNLAIKVTCLLGYHINSFSSLCRIAWKYSTHEIPDKDILLSVCQNLSLFSQLPLLQYQGFYDSNILFCSYDRVNSRSQYLSLYWWSHSVDTHGLFYARCSVRNGQNETDSHQRDVTVWRRVSCRHYIQKWLVDDLESNHYTNHRWSNVN